MHAQRPMLLVVAFCLMSFAFGPALFAATIAISTPADDTPEDPHPLIEGNGFGVISGTCSQYGLTIRVRATNTYPNPADPDINISTAHEWTTTTNPWTGQWSTVDPGSPDPIVLREGTWEVKAWIPAADPAVIDINDGPVTGAP